MSSSLYKARGNFASGAELVVTALKAFLPPDPVNVADFAAANRWLSNEGGGYVGRWNHEEAPYLIKPMMWLGADDKLTTVVVGPGQCGKSEIARNWLLSTALSDPADMLWYSGSEPLVAGEVKKNITRMIDDHKGLREILSRDSLAFKQFGAMTVQFLAGIISNFINKSAARIVVDEWDMIAKAMPGIEKLADLRRQSSGRRSMLLGLSHPDLAEGVEDKDWDSGIMSVYRKSDRHLWYWQCPHCGAFSSPNPTADRVMVLHYDEAAPLDEIADMARLLCPVNGCLIEDGQRRLMNLTGDWVGLGQQISQDGVVTGELVRRDIAGCWITGTMSAFLLRGIGGLAAARVEAERKFLVDNDLDAVRQVFAKDLGEPFAKRKRANEVDVKTLVERADDRLKLGEVAHGVRFITVMLDIQRNRFELLARGWMENGESCVVDFKLLDGDPSVSPSAWDAALAFATEHAWPLADGSARGMRAKLVGYDTGGEPGVTQQAYDAWDRLRAERKVRMMGRFDGRDGWSVLPMKGASSAASPRLQVVYPDTPRKDRFVVLHGRMPLAIFNPNRFKDDLAGQLLIAESQAWAVHFPAALKSETEPHLWFEQLLAEQRQPLGVWRRRKKGLPNEAMDLMVGTHVLAYLLGVQRLVWQQPPEWARPWDKNVMVVRLTATGEAAVPLTQPVGMLAAAAKPVRLINRIPLRR